jgi:uncharacterized protein (TIGR02466 family)
MSHFFDIFSLSFYYEENKNISDNLLPISKKILKDESLLTNEWGYKNTYSMDKGLSTLIELEFFNDFILEKSKLLYKKCGYDLKPEYKLWTSIFTSAMKQGDKHDPHSHPGAIYSGLMYLQVPKGSSPIQFKGPRDSIFNAVFEKRTKNKNIFNYENDGIIAIHPREGMFLMWDSWAIHRVPINNIDDERITMVFNVGVEKNEI